MPTSTKKSAAMIWPMWFARKVRDVCGDRPVTHDVFATVA
jgi:hypothetical protein